MGLPAEIAFQADEAEAALAISTKRRQGAAVEANDWARLFESEGYRRLAQRERAMGQAISDSSFHVFATSDSLVARSLRLTATLADWRRADLSVARRLALAYLPTGTHLRTTVYVMVKPKPNSFVYNVGTDSAAIFLYLNPDIGRAKLVNTVAHELHHIGYAMACRDPVGDPKAGEGVATAVGWMGAFGEGLAVLAAAGGPHVHPHAVSDSAERARWDRDMSHIAADFHHLEEFLLDVAESRLVDPDSISEGAMSFFGDAQGPWYTVGYTMAVEVERRLGRPRLIAVLCDPRQLVTAYQAAIEDDPTANDSSPRWSAEFLARLGR